MRSRLACVSAVSSTSTIDRSAGLSERKSGRWPARGGGGKSRRCQNARASNVPRSWKTRLVGWGAFTAIPLEVEGGRGFFPGRNGSLAVDTARLDAGQRIDRRVLGKPRDIGGE